MALLDKHCAQLGEHFDTIQIFATRYDEGGNTINACYGAGNWYARLGQVQSWLEKKNEEARVEVRPEDEQ